MPRRIATYRAPWPAPAPQVAGLRHHGHWCAEQRGSASRPSLCSRPRLPPLPLPLVLCLCSAPSRSLPFSHPLTAPLSFPAPLPSFAVYSHNVSNMEVELKTPVGTVTVPYGYPRGNYRTMVYALVCPNFLCVCF